VLVPQGYNYFAAADGADALQMLEDGVGPVHLALTDMVMPKMMGSELGRHVAQWRPDTRFLMMSGYSDDPLVRSFERVPEVFIASRVLCQSSPGARPTMARFADYERGTRAYMKASALR
jgi:CheY-like chemotaxis protein